jgi:hypothetical protein
MEKYRPNQDQQIRQSEGGFVYFPTPSISVEEHVLFDFATNSEQAAKPVISYKEWKQLNYAAEPGAIVTDVPPIELFTTQDWLRPDKAIRAVTAQEELVEDAFTVMGIAFSHPKEHVGVVPVLLEGNHRTVNALINSSRVNFKIADRELPPDAQVWRVTNLAKKYPGLFSKGL